MTTFHRMTRRAIACAAAIATCVSSAAPADASKALLSRAQSWTYQLAGNVAEIHSTNYDVAVVDWDHVGNRATVERLKQKPGGGRRAVISYIAIGEAEVGRPYWNSCCASSKPSWFTSKTQGWSGNYVTRFWQPGWKQIVFDRVQKIVAAGFDGIYLDRIDSWESMRGENPNARAAMIQLVKEVASRARGARSDFAIIVQNGEELLTDSSYVASIDAIAKESLFYGVNGIGTRNPSGMIAESMSLLKRAKASGKDIFVIEYLSGAQAEKTRPEIRAQGFVPFFGNRALQGQPKS
jgi:cysteinyl-tRNA synthetase